jgi:hypothetical protein
MKPLKAISAYGQTLIGLRSSDHIDHRVLAAGVAESHTVPTGAKYVVFSGTDDFYVNIGGTAAVPSGDVTDGSGSMINPGLRSIEGKTTISLISAAANVITMEFYS